MKHAKTAEAAARRLLERTVKSVRDAWPTRNHPSAERRSHPFIRERIEELRVLKQFTRDLADARAQLAALHAAASRFMHSLGEGLDDGTEGALNVTLVDLATAAREHEQSVRADERVAQLGIVRAAIASYRAAILIARRDKTVTVDMIPLLQAQDLAATQIWDQLERLMETR
jgi:hypothetical protein